MFKRQRWNLQPALWSRCLLRWSCRGSRSTRLKVCSRFISPPLCERRKNKAKRQICCWGMILTRPSPLPESLMSASRLVVLWLTRPFRGTWLPVTGLITPSVDRYLERSAHDGVIYSQGGASLHINHAQEHLQISLWSWSDSPLFSFEPSLLHIWKAIPTFLCNISNFRVILQLYLIPYIYLLVCGPNI